MDSSYNRVNAMPSAGVSTNGINAHEFTVFDNGARVLHFGTNDVHYDEAEAARRQLPAGRYQDDCVVQTHIASGRKEFEWCGLDNGISPSESFDVKGSSTARYPWDYLSVVIDTLFHTFEFADKSIVTQIPSINLPMEIISFRLATSTQSIESLRLTSRSRGGWVVNCPILLWTSTSLRNTTPGSYLRTKQQLSCHFWTTLLKPSINRTPLPRRLRRSCLHCTSPSNQ